MGKGIGINDLSTAISGMMNEYSNYVTEETKAVIKKTGKEAAKELQSRSPKSSGDYAASWRSKVTAETTHTVHVSVYAGNHQYSLTHLLENGHAKRGGGRVSGNRHIGPVNEAVTEKIIEEIKNQI